MDGVDLNSPNVGIGETDIHPWDLIRHGLSEELDTDQSLFHEVCTRAAQDLGPVFVQSVSNAEEFFAALQNNLSNDEVLMLDYLIALVGIVNLHSHQGSQPFKDVLLEYKKRLTKYREDYARVSQSRAEEFIGRTKDLKDVEENLIGNQYQGVALCGMGGMGKTSLATEVCYRLLNARKRWIVKKIDMREKDDLVDLLRDLVGEIGLDCNSTEIKDLYDELILGLSGIKDRLIFFIDNLDDMMRTAAKKSELLNFLEHFCKDLKSRQTEVRLLVTLRQKLVLEDKLKTTATQEIPRTAKRLSNRFFEIELQKLNQQDGKDLLRACCRRPLTASPDNEVCWKIVNFCGGSPLAIKTVGAAIRSGKVNPQMLAKKLEELPGLEIESQCLRQTFETMDKTKQEQLVKLHVFGTAKFDLAAAAFVLGEKSMSEETPIVFATTISMIYLKSRHFVEVDDLREETEDIKTASKTTTFSLHPLVHKFLIQVADNKDFEKAVYEAKCLFVDYVEKKNSKIFESFEKNCVKAWKELKDFKVHLKTYYDLIEKSSIEFWKMKTGTRSILTCKRISEVADLFLEDYYKYKLLKKYVEHSKARGDFLETALWQIHLGRKYFESDRNEIAEKMVIAILHNTLQNVKPDDDDLGPLVEVVGALFYLAGKLCLEERKYLEAMQYFQETKQLWANRLDKEMRKKYKIDLALVYNSLGKVYANLSPPNIQKSKYNHLKAFFIAYRISDNFNNIDIPLYIQNIGRCLYREGLELEKRKDKRTANQCFRDAETYYRQAMKLFMHFKMEKFDSFAEVQRNLAFVEMKLGEMGLAEDDIVKTHELRKMIMCPPHEVVTLTMHDVGTVRAERAIFMYWDYFTNKIGDKYGALNKLYQAVADYEHVMHLMKRGGLPRNHPEYENIKNTHIWILKQVKENKKLDKAIQFYKEFERGKFEAAGKKARSEKATTKFSYTHEELQTMFAAGVFEGAKIVKDSSSEESDDDSDANDDGVSQTSLSLGATSDDLVLNLRKTKLNFNYVFRECPPEEQLEFGDVMGDDYNIEEDFKGINVLDNFNACENLMEEVKDIEENSDEEMEFTEGPMKILERRTSNISVSSQSSLEEEDVEARRKRFARKGSRESSLQEFLEDRLSESKTVAKNRHLSSSSISFEVSMDEDVVLPEVKIHQDMQRLKQFIHERFAAKDKKSSEKKSQLDVKQKRARMQKQPTITEEPMGPQNLADDTTPTSKKRK